MSEERKIKVLCAEDEQDIRENIAEILRDEGFEVFEAADGKLGFESFVKNKPDIVISDVMMPGVDGYGLLKSIRESKSVKNNTVPFIFLTALGQKDNVIKGVKLSANDYLVKPIDFDLMIAKIKEKTLNATKLQDFHTGNINNIKKQVSNALPSELFSYLDIITKVSSFLKDQPYGPFPHEKYLQDIDKIYQNSLRLKSSITNSLDETVIDNRLSVDEEIFDATSFVEAFVTGLGEKFKTKVEFEVPFESNLLPKIKMDKMVLIEAVKKILSGMFKSDTSAKINISILIDHFDQMALIFNLETGNSEVDISETINQSEIGKILDTQSCRFETSEGKSKSSVLFIPSHRLITRS